MTQPWSPAEIERYARGALSRSAPSSSAAPGAPCQPAPAAIPESDPPPRSRWARRMGHRLAEAPVLGRAVRRVIHVARHRGLLPRIDAVLSGGPRGLLGHGLLYIKRRLYRVPVLGYAIRTVAILLRLPRLTDDLIRGLQQLSLRSDAALDRQQAQFESRFAAQRQEFASLRDETASLREQAAMLQRTLDSLRQAQVTARRQAAEAQIALDDLRQVAGALEQQGREIRAAIQALQSNDSALQAEIGRDTSALAEELRQNAQAFRQELDSASSAIGEFYPVLEQLQHRLEAKAEQEALEAASNAIGEFYPVLEQLQKRLEAKADEADAVHRIEAVQSFTAQQVTDLRRLVLTQPAPAPAAGAAAPAAPAPLADSRLDALYVSFEDRFRGDPAEIRRRLSVYLPRIAAGPVLDIGCGRGEWLDLLRERGVEAWGVDTNAIAIAECRKLSLRAEQRDALEALRSLPADSQGAVTAFHVIEHLPFPVLLAFLDETLRVLRPGGVAIFETPNTANLQVGTYNFWLDPSHIKPIPSGTAAFFLEARGFADVEILPLNPMEQAANHYDDPLLERVNQLIHGPQEYAVVGRK